jgi:hypothetical protein
MDRYLNWKVGLLVALALFGFGQRYCIRNNAPESVKAKCAREPVDFLYRNQYSDCLRRSM